MNDNAQGSNSEAEQTVSVSSPDTQDTDVELVDESTGAEDVQSDSQSSEDSNTQSDDGTESKGLSDKAQNRFQTLANRTRDLEEQNRELSARMQAEQRMVQAEQSVRTRMQQTQDPSYRYEAQLALQNAELMRIKEDREFEKAAAKYPELNPDGKDYDRSFHDDVWLIREGSRGGDGTARLTYEQAAAKLASRNAKIASKAAHEAETQIAAKESVTTGSQKRTVQTSGAGNALKLAQERFSQTGSIDDLQALLRAKEALQSK